MPSQKVSPLMILVIAVLVLSPFVSCAWSCASGETAETLTFFLASLRAMDGPDSIIWLLCMIWPIALIAWALWRIVSRSRPGPGRSRSTPEGRRAASHE